MLDFMDAVVFGFKGIFKIKTMKFAMTSGLIISAIWILIGMFFWDGIISTTSTILTLIPFSMLRSDGAWMLSAFLWLQLVLITFAVLFSFLGNFIATRISRNNYDTLSVVVGLSSAVFWGIVWFFEHDFIYANFLKLLTWLPFETIEKGLSYLIGFYIIYMAIIANMIFVTSMFSNKFLSEINEKGVPCDTMYDESKYNNVKQTLKDTAIFTGISIISSPLFFIPFINFIILVGLWAWFMKDTLAYATASFVFGNRKEEKLKEFKKPIWGLNMIGSLFNFIPVFNVFGPYFTELAMFHYFKEQRDK